MDHTLNVTAGANTGTPPGCAEDERTFTLDWKRFLTMEHMTHSTTSTTFPRPLPEKRPLRPAQQTTTSRTIRSTTTMDPCLRLRRRLQLRTPRLTMTSVS